MKDTKKPFYVKRLTKHQSDEAIQRYADANKSDPFATRRAESRIRYGLFDLEKGQAHVY